MLNKWAKAIQEIACRISAKAASFLIGNLQLKLEAIHLTLNPTGIAVLPFRQPLSYQTYEATIPTPLHLGHTLRTEVQNVLAYLDRNLVAWYTKSAAKQTERYSHKIEHNFLPK